MCSLEQPRLRLPIPLRLRTSLITPSKARFPFHLTSSSVPTSLHLALAHLDSPQAPEAYLRISSHPASTAAVASFRIDSQLKSSAWTKVTISFLAEILDGVLSASQLMTLREPGASSIDRLESGYFSYPPGWAVPPETSARVWLSGFHLQLNNNEDWY